MQPHTRVQDCSCDTTESQEDQAPTTARYGEAQRRNEQDRQDLEDMAFNGLGQEMEEINMSMASSIPTQIGAGYVLDTPLVVLLHRGMRSSTAIGDIWVFVSLINAGPDIPAGGSEDVLNGQRADNAHPILGYCSMRDDAFAYASFSNLSISRSGRYRLCITAIDMRFVRRFIEKADADRY